MYYIHMCGIIGVLGTECIDIILDGLNQLQNRGYDSAGISTILNGAIISTKYASVDSDSAIDKLVESRSLHTKSINGMGHTRWATHGPKTDNNSHPHVSMRNIFSVSHNGIIENYKKIKRMLISKHGYTFKSETDSEVISNLIEHNYIGITQQHSSETSDMAAVLAIQKTIEQLEGTWGLVIQCAHAPNSLYCTRHGSPILVSENNTHVIIASEQSGFCGRTPNYFVLKNYDICHVKYDTALNKIRVDTNEPYDHTKMKSVSSADLHTFSPDPFEHWMLKEIHEQPESALRAISLGGRVLTNNEVKLGGLSGHKDKLMQMDNLIILGCGTSYNAGLFGSHFFKELCHFNTVQVIDGADFSACDIPKYGKTVCILLSQSGETKDLHRCIQIGQDNDIFLVGVVNVVDSLIARECNCGCYLNAGREVGVASTKSFTSQVILLSMIAVWFSQNKSMHDTRRSQYINDLRSLYKDIQKTIEWTDDFIQHYVKHMFTNETSCFLLGKGRGEAIAREGALKMKEIAYIHAESYSTSSLKHGPFALLQPGFPVIMFSSDNKHYTKVMNAYEEVKSRNASILLITNSHTYFAQMVDDPQTVVLKIPENNTFDELLGIIPIQLLSYYLSIGQGNNPDRPRNLAKVVTVE